MDLKKVQIIVMTYNDFVSFFLFVPFSLCEWCVHASHHCCWVHCQSSRKPPKVSILSLFTFVSSWKYWALQKYLAYCCSMWATWLQKRKTLKKICSSNFQVKSFIISEEYILIQLTCRQGTWLVKAVTRTSRNFNTVIKTFERLNK